MGGKAMDRVWVKRTEDHYYVYGDEKMKKLMFGLSKSNGKKYFNFDKHFPVGEVRVGVMQCEEV